MLKNEFTAGDEVSFNYLKPVTLTNRTALKQFLLKLVRKESKAGAQLSFVFCSDKHLLKMNRRFLNHDYYTDILTFPLDSPPGIIAGEMYLSIDRIRDNAKTLQNPLYRELHRVIFHGVLHLCGYKDKTAADLAIMRSKEDHYLDQYFKSSFKA